MPSEPDYTTIFERLRNVPGSPDDAWLTGTAQVIYELPLELDDQPVRIGPDGLPYFGFWLPGEEPKPEWATVERVLDYAISSRVGLEFFTSAGFRFWFVPHGGVLSWRLYGTPNAPRFWNAAPEVEKHEVLSDPEYAWFGRPNDEMLPPLVREALKWVMTERLGIANPRIGLIQRAGEAGVSRLVPALDPSRLGGDEAAREAFKLLLWFVPSCIPMIHMPSVANGEWMAEL